MRKNVLARSIDFLKDLYRSSLKLKEFLRFNGTNFSGLRMVKPQFIVTDVPKVMEMEKSLESFSNSYQTKFSMHNSKFENIQGLKACFNDGKKLKKIEGLPFPFSPTSTCDNFEIDSLSQARKLSFTEIGKIKSPKDRNETIFKNYVDKIQTQIVCFD